ncbi:unnamed protein product [Phytophthora fragariaefolia]|uniref:Unnamed protein product n=1 Tax=Phytophthora fragariaefolia TaxID=1490495 RepID=A0A9W6XGU4_9STRA|nr:unnamed protein product [Phytophthora fragariaefolia]
MVAESESKDASGQSEQVSAMSPVASSKKTKYQKKSRLQEQVEAMPAVRDENQALVDQLVQLGEYEMRHGRSQRGLSRFRAAKEIRDSNVAITSGAQAKKLERVGQAVATKVDQLLNEGLAAALSEYKGDEEALPVANGGGYYSLVERRKGSNSSGYLDIVRALSESVFRFLAAQANLCEAQDELQQKYDLELEWKQLMEIQEAKRQHRRQSHKKKTPSHANKPIAPMNIGSSPPDDENKTGANEGHRENIQGERSSTTRMGMVTSSKRPIRIQESMRGNAETKVVARKAKKARRLIVTAPSDDEEKNPPPSEKVGLENILINYDNTESPDQGIADLLQLEDLDDTEDGSDVSSNGEFSL